jgi:hypothetical protein
VGEYCHECGQSSADHLGSLRAFAAHVAAVLLAYDSRALRTAARLLFRPVALRRVYAVRWPGAVLRALGLVVVYQIILIAWLETVVTYARRHI